MTHSAANEFVRLLHRHSRPTLGAIFCIGVADDAVRGVAVRCRRGRRAEAGEQRSDDDA
jgi:hypothetical protein